MTDSSPNQNLGKSPGERRHGQKRESHSALSPLPESLQPLQTVQQLKYYNSQMPRKTNTQILNSVCTP